VAEGVAEEVGQAGRLETDTVAGFDHLFAVNVRAQYFLIQRLLPILRDGGRIISLSSVATRFANPIQTSFAMTKAAVETMSMTLALTGQTVDATGGLFLGPRFA
jgi:3-oxoacyl-[acyl-carrier protein] reductase